MKPELYFISVLLLLLPLNLSGQVRTDIDGHLSDLRAGRREQVEEKLRSLLKKYPEDPGVLYLQGMLTTNGEEAIVLYQRIVNEHAGSSWADDALYRLYQYSYAVGAYRTARMYMDRLQNDFSSSPYLTRGSGKKPATKTSTVSSRGYSVQVAAYSKEKDAERQRKDLLKLGYTTVQIREKQSGNKTLYAVWLGIFQEAGQARAFIKKLEQQHGIKGILVRR